MSAPGLPSIHKNRFIVAAIVTRPAADTCLVINKVQLLFLTADGADRADARTQGTAIADVRDLVGDQPGAHGRRATVFGDVRQVLVAKVAQRRQHGVGRCLSQPAQRAVLDRNGQRLQPLQVFQCALAGLDTFQDPQHLSRANPARGTLTTRFGPGKVQKVMRDVHRAVILVHNHDAA